MSLAVQIATMLSMVGTGMGMAWIYDFYTWFRRKLHPHPIIVFIWDVLYWLLFSVLVFAVLSTVNEGRLRFPVFLALLLGGIIYFWFFSRPFLEAWEVIVDWIKRTLRFLYSIILRLILSPLKWLVTLTLACLLWLGTAIWKAMNMLMIATFKMFAMILRPVQRLSIALVRFLGKIITRLIPFQKRDE